MKEIQFTLSVPSVVLSVGVVLAAGLSIAALTQDAAPIGDKLTVRELEIRAPGKTSAMIRVWADEEGAHFNMQTADEEGEVAINLNSKVVDGRSISDAGIALFDSKGDTTVNPGVFGGSINGKVAWHLGELEGAPSFVMFDSKGAPKAFLGTLPSGDGHILLRSNSGSELSLAPPEKK